MGDSVQGSVIHDYLPTLTTHRHHLGGAGSNENFFLYESFLAGISIFFCRATLKSHSDEPLLLRLFFALVLSFLAYNKKPYEIICAVQLFSYAVPKWLAYFRQQEATNNNNNSKHSVVRNNVHCLLTIAVSAILSLGVCKLFGSGEAMPFVVMLTPASVKNGFHYLFPVVELQEAYRIISQFMDTDILHRHLWHLLFVTFNIQVGMGFLGISFLKREQMRRNELVRMELVSADDEEDAEKKNTNTNVVSRSNGGNEKSEGLSDDVREKQLKNSKKFRRGAVPFIFYAVMPYMAQIIAFGNMNQFAMFCVQDDIHRAVRLNELFDHDSHLTAMAAKSATSPGAYADAMDTVVSTSYDIFNRKFFSLPKLLLLPGVIMKQPIMLAKIFPFIFITDVLKARLVAVMTSEIERTERESKEIQAIRTKVEAFDMKNAELLQRSGAGATQFTRQRWEELTEAIQERRVASALLRRTRGFFEWLQRNFVFSALIDCALAQLIAVGKIVSAEIFVFSRAIEDFVDLILMRSRAESELATMMTQIEKLQGLSDVWQESKDQSLVPCQIVSPQSPNSTFVSIRHLRYSRGTALVTVDHLDLKPGIYAVTGANGSGKSTLFRVIMACNTNDKSIDLPPSIVLQSLSEEAISEEAIAQDCPAEGCDAEGHASLSISMPSSGVEEISQTFYWPLYTKPIDWIVQSHLSKMENVERKDMLLRVADLLQSLAFSQSTSEEEEEVPIDSNTTILALPPADMATTKLMGELDKEKEDWFNDLSGGQKSKVELVRKVLLHDACPKVLLIDETMAPLDPTSKSLVMSKIKGFCGESVVLVIYHTDVGREVEGSDDVECVPSNNFFDYNLHVEKRVLIHRPVC